MNLPRIDSTKVESGPSQPDTRTLLRWIYAGRVIVSIAVFLAAALSVKDLSSVRVLIISVATVLTIIVSGASWWYTEVARAKPGENYYYLQTLFDLGLVTTIVYATGGVNSDFASLYILVIAISSLLLPLPASLLLTVLAGILYFAVVFWFNPVQVDLALWLQLGVFAFVAVGSGWIGRKVRVVGEQRAELEQEVERLRLEAGDILQNLRTGVITVNNDGYLAYANPAAEALLGFRTTLAVESNFVDFLRDLSPELARVIQATHDRGMGVQRFEADVTVNGRQFPIGVTTTAFELDQPQSKTVTAIFADISDRKRLDDLKLRNERLEAVAELSASLAHEIKNPLASIRSSVEQLSALRTAGEDERVLVQLVMRESDRLSRLLTEFLDFSRVKVTNHGTVNLLALGEEAAKVLRQHPDFREGCEVKVGGEEVELRGDQDLLHRVVFNLALNALQAAGENARVEIEVMGPGRIQVPPEVDIDRPAVLTVSDNGPGIPREQIARLFDPFFSGRVGGSGLGLAIVQRAVEAHGGVIFVDSKEGVGSEFTVVIPCQATEEEAS